MSTSQRLTHTRQFSHEDGPYAGIVWERRTSTIKKSDGKVVFFNDNVAVPSSWSQLATDIIASKYFRKAGLFGNKNEGETSARQVIERITTTIARYGMEAGYFEDQDSANAFRDDLAYLLVHQYGAFNSPVWFNVGLDQYAIKGPPGQYRYDPKLGKVVVLDDAFEHGQASACFIQSVQDDFMGIYQLLTQEARVFRGGSGTGSNFSTIRSRYESLSGGGTSSGLMSFLEVLDRAAGSTKSGGTTRRSSKMVVLDMDHPEIVDFIEWKLREEKKAQALIAAGYPSDFEGEAYRTVSGQNSNNSVRITDAFMKMVEVNGKWQTRMRTTGAVVHDYYAADLWNKIAEAAWACGDPGVQFDTTINEWHTCPNSGRINASNPCSEYVFLDQTACNLASLRLTRFVKFESNNTWSFDIERYAKAARIFFIAQEILVGYSSYPTEAIALNSHRFRPLGLGYADLGALLMQVGVPYDSDSGRNLAAALTSMLSAVAAETSAEMAQAMGAFEGHAENREPMMGVIKKHYRHARSAWENFRLGDAATRVASDIIQESTERWKNAIHIGNLHGFRNAQLSVMAPTGTIGLLMDCDTTGVEPDFALVKYKKLAGEGNLKIVNQSVMRGLKSLGYEASEIEKITSYLIQRDSIEGCDLIREEHLPVFDCANKAPGGKRYIRPEAHVLMIAAVQPFLSGSSSKTCNLPNDATVEDIKALYMLAWRSGVKCLALYRDGSKGSQPLNVAKDKAPAPTQAVAEPAKAPEPVTAPTLTLDKPRGYRERLQGRRSGFTQESRVGGHKLFLRTGEYPDGRVGELFVDMHKEGASFRSLMNCFTIAVSMGLQYGIPLEDFVEQFTFTRFEPQGPVEGDEHIKFSTSIIDYVFRVLGTEYLGQWDLAQKKPAEVEVRTEETPAVIKEDPVPTSKNQGDAPLCDQCGEITVRNASCFRCLRCGTSMGCS